MTRVQYLSAGRNYAHLNAVKNAPAEIYAGCIKTD